MSRSFSFVREKGLPIRLRIVYSISGSLLSVSKLSGHGHLLGGHLQKLGVDVYSTGIVLLPLPRCI